MVSSVFAHGAADGLFVAVAGLVGVSAALISRRRMPPARRGRMLLALAAAGGIGFQLFHATEHMAQVSYWLAQPAAPPWLSPWAEMGVGIIAGLTDGRHGTGAELLHLLGNVVFLTGLAAALQLAATQHRPDTRLLRVALWVQAAHVGEHLLLTTTWLAVGRTLGVSTAFGALAANPTAAVTARVWVHLVMNLVGIVLALRGVQQTWLPAVNHQKRPGLLGDTQDERDGVVQRRVG